MQRFLSRFNVKWLRFKPAVSIDYYYYFQEKMYRILLSIHPCGSFLNEGLKEKE